MQRRTEVVIRVIDPNNIKHHLFDNNGTWWMSYTRHNADYTKERVRESLHTSELATAIQRRDERLKMLLHDDEGSQDASSSSNPACTNRMRRSPMDSMLVAN